MTEQKNQTWIALALLVSQVIVGLAVHFSAVCMRENWANVVSERSLPDQTHLAFMYGPYIPVVVGGLCVVILLSLRGKHPLGHWLWPLMIAEIIAICLFISGITMPASRINYGLGP